MPLQQQQRRSPRDSLAALEQLGRAKGYDLVHTDSAGVNAFFVRRDLRDGLSLGPVARHGVNHYQAGSKYHPGSEGTPWLVPTDGEP